jgi:hypothetical protein
MYAKKKRIKELVEDYYELGAVEKINRITQIRSYVSTQKWETVADEIRACQNTQELKVLLGAGMKGVLWSITVKKFAELSGQ